MVFVKHLPFCFEICSGNDKARIAQHNPFPNTFQSSKIVLFNKYFEFLICYNVNGS